MLKRFPETALRFAIDGVIAPSVLREAARAVQLEHYARRRAAALMAPLPGHIERVKKEARLEGYAQGYVEGITQAVPHLAAMLADAQAVRATLRQQLCDAVRCSLEDEDVAAELIVQRCEKSMADADDLVLYLPESNPQLRQAVSGKLQALAASRNVVLRSTNGPYPLLQAGGRLLELDPAGALLAAIDLEAGAPALDAEARARARAYVEGFNLSMRSPAPIPAPEESI